MDVKNKMWIKSKEQGGRHYCADMAITLITEKYRPDRKKGLRVYEIVNTEERANELYTIFEKCLALSKAITGD